MFVTLNHLRQMQITSRDEIIIFKQHKTESTNKASYHLLQDCKKVLSVQQTKHQSNVR